MSRPVQPSLFENQPDESAQLLPLDQYDVIAVCYSGGKDSLERDDVVELEVLTRRDGDPELEGRRVVGSDDTGDGLPVGLRCGHGRDATKGVRHPRPSWTGRPGMSGLRCL